MIQDSLTVLADQSWSLPGVLAVIALGQALVAAALRFVFGAQLTLHDRLALGLTGWILPAALFSLTGWLIGFVPALTLLLLLLALIPVLTRLKLSAEPDSPKIAFALLALLLFSLLSRLPFAARAFLPSYFDSAQHYALIKAILLEGVSLPPGLPYYHTGFHALAAFLVTLTDADIARTMLILGQVVLAVMPVSLFFLIRHITQSAAAAFFTVILSAFGWYMPAHAVNWGKYPALLSLALLPFVVSLAYLIFRNDKDFSPKQRTAAYTLLALGILVTVWLHTRALILLLTALAAWLFAVWRQRLPRSWRIALLFVALALLTLETVALQQQALFTLVLDPYLVKGIWVTVPVLLLSVFAGRDHPRIVFACLVFMILILGALFIPLQIPGYGPLTLLDRPLVETILYLPLTLLGGLGWAGLEKSLPQTLFKKVSIRGILFALLSGLVIIHAFATYKFYPSDCCILAGHDDLAAITWMDARLPADTRIGISVTEMNVSPTDELEGYAGADAGIWITPLIDRVTFPLMYGSDFGDQAVHAALCQNQVSYLFVGELGQSFDPARLEARPGWYRAVLSMPEARVYEVVGCAPSP